MNKVFRKAASFVMTLALVVSLLSVMAFAADGKYFSISATKTGDNTVNVVVTTTKKITDLGSINGTFTAPSGFKMTSMNGDYLKKIGTLSGDTDPSWFYGEVEGGAEIEANTVLFDAVYTSDSSIGEGSYDFTFTVTSSTKGTDYSNHEIKDDTASDTLIVHTHSLTAVAAKAATCTETGNGAYWQCSGQNGCGKLFLDAAGTQETTLASVTTAIDPDAHNYENGKCTRCSAIQPAYELYVVVDKTTDTDSDGYYDVNPGDTVTADVYIKANSNVQLQSICFKLTANEKLTRGNVSLDGFTFKDGYYYDYATKRSLTENTGLKLGSITYTVGSGAAYNEQLGITLSDASVTAYLGTDKITSAVKGTGVEIATIYTITWNINGKTDTTEVPYGQVPSYDKTINRPGYTCTGWDPSPAAATGNVTYTAQWTCNYNFVTEQYRYAGADQVLLILKADAPDTGSCYTYDSEPMFYTNDKYYCASIEGATGVYVYLIPAADVTNDTAAGKIAVGTGTNETITRDGNINIDAATDITDASIVYRMLKEGGSAYNTLSIKQRLEADVSTSTKNADYRGSIADVDAIVDIFFKK